MEDEFNPDTTGADCATCELNTDCCMECIMMLDAAGLLDRRVRAQPTENDMTAVIATWTVELNCDCPGCGEHVDLLDYADFWDGRQLDVPEHGTERSRGVEVVCPECGHEFTVDCQY